MKGLGFNLLKYTEGLRVGKSVISVCKSDLKRQTEGFYGSEKVAKISHFSDLFTISVKTVFSAVKDAKFSVSYVKGAPYFVRRWYTKKVPFLSKTAYKRDSLPAPINFEQYPWDHSPYFLKLLKRKGTNHLIFQTELTMLAM